PRVMAGSGRSYDAVSTAVFPPARTGASVDTRPSSDEPCGASTATTPVGSGTEKSKYGPATGLLDPTTCAILSVHPAYQTQRSMASPTSRSALARVTPSPALTSSTNWA